MKTTKQTKTTPSVVVPPAAPAPPGGYTIWLDLGGAAMMAVSVTWAQLGLAAGKAAEGRTHSP